MVPMKIHEETFTALNGSCAEPGQLFFDIESTGLNPRYAAVYLIGCSWFEDGEWQLRLYFADDRRAECDVLRTFADLLRGFSTVVHFNGDRFDIPFLQERMARYGLGDPFAGMGSIDLLKRVRPYKKLLGVENLKQKTLERFLGIDREDLFGGGELIQVYEEYLYSEDPRLEHFLLLHNLEDVKGMSELTALLRIPEWMEGRFELCGCCAGGNDAEDVSDAACSQLTFHSEVPFPGRSLLNSCGCRMEACGHDLTLTLPCFGGRVRMYYPNTKDYYYLPEEGCAVHKSVSAFVDPKRRIRATAENCFGLCAPEDLSAAENASAFAQSWIRRFWKGK